jgi:hypothetical protein
MEAIFTSEMSGKFQQTTRRHIPEDKPLRLVHESARLNMTVSVPTPTQFTLPDNKHQ